MTQLSWQDATIEWFGATTFRLQAKGLTIFLDTWLERPSVMPTFLRIDEVTHADYIFISHAHFDHLPGCDRLAKQTGAIVIANGEAINVLRGAGVPEEQLLPVAGGERIPLFLSKTRQDATGGKCRLAGGPPGAPPLPHSDLAVAEVHVWPSLHCLLPGQSHADIPDVMDTGTKYSGSSPYACTIDITRGMRYGLLRLGEIVPAERLDDGEKSFVEYVADTKRNVMSNFDGGQLCFSLLVDERTLCWNGHLGGYSAILQTIRPQPDVLIQAIAGRANIDGWPFDGSAAEAASDICRWLGQPQRVIWCLHDDAPIKPWRIDTKAATEMVEAVTKSRIHSLDHAVKVKVFPS
ncbi:hypothetical protein BAUCODRAFT_148902 [Baudoinia panamericana UAMH 10762]|uniref:Metallo-beta-lactamase domain-containing protein n=1 Tax=Baudoinia panamericana (strain UAMH 10762) TaxID=717646 RepID=M2MX02_BAUPA|nr:uncharacterized protein BAUCODRAFT_148902 [Baudoinia panamericana UAMH 10762]EMC96068.1 hypothetical protein BAUCODRAFT_148902 [Baudoinia panamericana UAMH 10762]